MTSYVLLTARGRTNGWIIHHNSTSLALTLKGFDACQSSKKLDASQSTFTASLINVNPRSLESWCVKGTEDSLSKTDFSVPLMHNDSSDKEMQNPFA